MTDKEILTRHITYLLTDDQVTFILALLRNQRSLHSLLELSGYDTKQTFDSAYPVDYFNRIKELYPAIDKGNFIYDYSKKSFGELVNVNDLLVNNMFKTFNP